MILINERLPEYGQVIIGYCKDGTWSIYEYKKTLTWHGFKVLFINVFNHFFDDGELVGWNRIPTRDETI